MLEEFRLNLLNQMSAHPESLTHDKLVTASWIVGAPLVPDLTPERVMQTQMLFAQEAAAQPQPAPRGGAPKRKIAGISEASTLSTGQMR
jgi:hypothetical protein